MKPLLVKGEEAMLAVGAELLQNCEVGGVITLSGDLGAGKTTLVRGVLAGLGYQGHVRSPTYTLVEPYPLDQLTVAHFDLYRLADAEELEYLGYREFLNPQTVCLVEWPEMASHYFVAADLHLTIDYHPQGRTLQWITQSDWGEARATCLSSRLG